MSDAMPDVLRLRGRLATLTEEPTAEFQLDWAEACAAAGHADAARLLARCAFIRAGFSPQLRDRRRAVAERLGIAVRPAAPAPRPDRDMISIALDEWRGMTAAMAGHVAAALVERDPEALSHRVRDVRPVEIGSQFGVADSVAGLFDLLDGPAPVDWLPADALLSATVVAVESFTVIEGAAIAGADLPMIASALSCAGLRDFVARQRDLLDGPYGCTELLWRSAQFDHCGLGPYLANIPRLARDSRDLFEFASVAAETACRQGFTQVGPAPWLLLLCHDLSPLPFAELIDELGDRGDMVTLGIILHGAPFRAVDPVGADLVRRLRDAALDHGDHALAARAQMRLVDRDPLSITELALLGSFEASAGHFVAAEQSFLACLLLDPLNIEVATWLTALRRRAFEPFSIKAGYTTPPDRRINRMLASEARPDVEDRAMANPLAVQFR